MLTWRDLVLVATFVCALLAVLVLFHVITPS